MERTENYKVEKRMVHDTPLIITSYQIGEKYYCHITNEDPGATIARSEGMNREEAVKHALGKALKRLG